MINKDQVIAAFCNNLGQGRGNTTQVLFALYNVASSYTKVLETMERQIQQCFSVLAPQATLEQRLLITAIQRRIGIEALPHYATPPTHSTPDQRACALDALKQRSILKLADVQELFAACTDARDLSTATVKQLLNSEFSYNVGEISWKLLSQSWDMMPEAWTFVVDALGEQNPLICGVATLLLQRGKNIPQGEREKAKASIRAILADEQLARRPLDAPGGEIMRLDDVLFEALRALAE